MLLMAGDSTGSDEAFYPQVVVDARQVTLADVMVLSALPHELQSLAGELELAVAPPDLEQARFTSHAIARRARTLAPALGPYLDDVAHQEIVVRFGAAPEIEASTSVVASRCMRVTRSIERGQSVAAGDLEPAGCMADEVRPPFAYDARRSAYRATESLATGDIVRVDALAELPQVAPGQTISVVSAIGPVRVSRTAIALQPGQPGQTIFARISDGSVVTATIPEGGR